MESKMGSAAVCGMVMVFYILITVSSAQLTFSRQWVRGNNPGDRTGGDISNFQRAAKAALAQRSVTKHIGPIMLDSIPANILANDHLLEELMERTRKASKRLSLARRAESEDNSNDYKK